MHQIERKCRLAGKQLVMSIFQKQTGVLNDERYNAIIYWIIFGKKPNLHNPRTFNEHILWRKIYLDEHDLWRFTDKYEVRAYVEKTIGAEYLNLIYGIFGAYDEIDLDQLPNSFVLKGTHGSGFNVIVSDKRMLNRAQVRRKFAKWLKCNYYYISREKNYFEIQPRILCDAFIPHKVEEGLKELKIFCFNGEPRFFAYNIVKGAKTRTNVYLSDGTLLPVKKGYEVIGEIELPTKMVKILDVARKLAQPFPFVRVDLYHVDDRVVFSELTFHSGGGFVPFEPPEYDLHLGRFFDEISQSEVLRCPV